MTPPWGSRCKPGACVKILARAKRDLLLLAIPYKIVMEEADVTKNSRP